MVFRIQGMVNPGNEDRMRIRFCIVLCILFVIVSALPVQSAEITVTPSIGFKGEYNDNIDFSDTDRIDDYAGILSPAVGFRYGIARFSMNSQAGGDFMFYANDTTRNENRGRFDVDATYRPHERITFSVNGGYSRDSTLESLLEETGIVEQRSDRDTYRVGGGLSCRTGETSSLTLSYDFSRDTYELLEFTDSEEQSIALSYQYGLNSGRDILTVSASCGLNDSDRSVTDNYGFSVGLNRQISETLRASVSAGVRYTVIDSVSRESEEDWGWTANVALGKSWQRVETDLGYSRDLDFSAEGETVEVNRFFLTVTAMLTRKLDLQCSGSLYHTTTVGAGRERDTRYLEIAPSLLYRLTQNHFLKVLYAYSHQNEKTLGRDRTVDRNRVLLILNFNFPMRL